MLIREAAASRYGACGHHARRERGVRHDWHLETMSEAEPFAVLPQPSAPSTRDGTPVLIHLTGQVGISVENRFIGLTGSAAALVAFAALEPAMTRRRASLMLWPDSPERQARNNLRTLIHRLGRQLGVELFAGDDTVALRDAHVVVRTISAEAIVEALGRGGARACELVSDAGLEDLEELQAWLGSARERFSRQLVDTLRQAQAAALARADSACAIAFARASVSLQPMSEHAHRQLMHMLTACGDRAAALLAYEVCKQTLLDNLGALPDERTRSLHVRILRSEREGALAAAAPVSHDAAGTLIERDAALAALNTARAQGCHIALEGEAGVGKTRLLRHLDDAHALAPITIRAGSRHEPYAALSQLLREVQQRHAPCLERSVRIELAGVAPEAFPDVSPSTAQHAPSRVRTALRAWAKCLHDSGLATLALDDLHCADAQSQGVLQELVAPRSDGLATLRLLATYRSNELGSELADALAAARVRGSLQVVRLERLTRDGTEALLLARGAPAATVRDEAARLFHVTGGNPLFLIELTLEGASDSARHSAGAAVTNLKALLLSRLSVCSTTARHLTYVAGVAGPDFSVELAAHITAKSPLALMPAWAELQGRGIFSDQGLAHDLVREATLVDLPEAIKGAVHRQVALYLESIGRRGAQVLHHWLEGSDCDRALPHARLSSARLTLAAPDTANADHLMLRVVSGLSDELLLESLWDCADLELWHLPAQCVTRFAALVERVERLAKRDDARLWLQYQRGRQAFYLEQRCFAGYSRVLEVAGHDTLAAERVAMIETQLAMMSADFTGGTPTVHAQRAVQALMRVPASRQNARLRANVDHVTVRFATDSAHALRQAARALRAARKAADNGLVAEARMSLATCFMANGAMPAALRQYRALAELHGEDGPGWFTSKAPVVGPMDLLCGRFDDAISVCEAYMNRPGHDRALVYSALVNAWLQLGRLDLAQQCVAADTGVLSIPALVRRRATALSRVAEASGGDAQEPLERAISQLRGQGAELLPARLLGAELARLKGSLQDRIDTGRQIIRLQQGADGDAGKARQGLLLLAEALADAGDAEARVVALRGASLARRGRVVMGEYPPDELARYAALLRETDPGIAASLRQVARRWVENALPHVPEEARGTFLTANPVNRALLHA